MQSFWKKLFKGLLKENKKWIHEIEETVTYGSEHFGLIKKKD